MTNVGGFFGVNLIGRLGERGGRWFKSLRPIPNSHLFLVELAQDFDNGTSIVLESKLMLN
jgi:hypothetical protein